jgi:succinate-semialdehyde dehydrogenase/glutarate-semialdehyde dehydrogenase
MSLESINPTTGERLRTYAEHSAAEIQHRLDVASTAFANWRRLGIEGRGAYLQAVTGVLRRDREVLAALMAQEMGKPIAQGRAEIDKCAWNCTYFAEQAAAFLAPEHVPTEFARSFVACEPLGLVLAIMPWNFPFWQVFRCAAPALMAGNVVALKHASNVTGCALAIEGVFREADLPVGVFQVLQVGSGNMDVVWSHPAVRSVAFTGSTEAGRCVGRRAVERLRKTVLELGGSDPYLVLEDADLSRAAEVCAQARLLNNGQSCIAAKRFIVLEAVHEPFVERFKAAMARSVVGDPLKEKTMVGPLARSDLRDALHGQVERSVARGARIVLGGERPAGPGAFYPPTVLVGVEPGMAAFDEETFGPVAAVTRAKDEAEAIRLANQSAFGLGAAVFTADTARGERVARELEAGCCLVNDFVRSDPRLPFGGTKDSGYGRELGRAGLREFVNLKTVMIR